MRLIHKEDIWGDRNLPDKITVSDLSDIIKKVDKELKKSEAIK